ncbi:MAG: hypothetical protein GXY15_14550 [Candidatus Hydrogenedentes bacterium]|nr:hypothetical protein [Candidatus Hydrogenedentota bacterium]
MTPDEQRTETPPPAAADAGPGGLFLPAALFGAAVLLLALADIGERSLLTREPWAGGLVCLDGETPPPPDALAVRARMVSRDHPAPGDRELRLLHDWAVDADAAPRFRADTPELAVAVSVLREDLAPLLASGRLPEPGAPEALAGDLAREDAFALAGQPFTVVGRLRRNVSGFLFSYLIPDDPALDAAFPDDGATVEGWAHPDGMSLLADDEAAEVSEDSEEGDGMAPVAAAGEDSGGTPEEEEDPAALVPPWQGGETRTAPLVAWAGFTGLLLAALSAWMAHTRLCRRWAATLPDGHFFLPLFGEVAARPRLWTGMHAALYALLFSAMFSMMSQPLLAHRFSAYIGAVFTGGGLEHVGRAYASGNVLEAAWFTWKNNFLEETVLNTVLLSLFPLALGVVKNAFTFLLVGAGLAPVWVGRSGTYAFHVVTMILELEIYALASFAVTAWALRVFAFFRKPGSGAFWGLLTGVRVLGGTILYAGLVLAAAAFYEAVTLIGTMP